MIVALVSCCGPKLAVPAPAKDLYQSDLFKKSRAYAERHADTWAILSAQHGVVLPDQILAPYEKSVRDLSTRWVGNPRCSGCYTERSRWREHLHAELHRLFPEADAFLFLAGEEYDCSREWHPDGKTRCELRFVFPLEGLQIGERKRWLKAQLEAEAA